MAYNAKLNSCMNATRQEIIDAVDNDNIGEWLDNSMLDIWYKDDGAAILLAYGGPTIILDTSTSVLLGIWGGDKSLEYIGDNYTYDINCFLERYVY